MAELNERFLGEAGPTDVLAFPIDDEPEPGGRSPDEGGTGPGGRSRLEGEIPLLLGDVVVCPAVAARNASEHGVEPRTRWSCSWSTDCCTFSGMDHEEDDEAERMEQRERELSTRFGSSGG